MNHFLGLIILSLCVATVFALINPERKENPARYFLKLLAYMIVGSWAFSWLMHLIV